MPPAMKAVYAEDSTGIAQEPHLTAEQYYIQGCVRAVCVQLLVHHPVLPQAVSGAGVALARLNLAPQAQDALDGCLPVLAQR